jgi:hypothetical protein
MTFSTQGKPYLRALIGCQEDDYVTVRYEMVKASYPVHKEVEPKYKEIPHILRRPRLTDEQFAEYLSQYGDLGFDKLPEWVRLELSHRTIVDKNIRDERGLREWANVTEPTELQEWETVSDAYEHRVLNNEMTIKDFMDHYTGKRNYNHV